MPITLGILAQSRQEAAGATFQLLESTVLTGAQSSIEFTNLATKYASTYQHLQIRAVVQSTRASSLDALIMQFNGDTAGNYSRHTLQGDGGSVSSSGVANATYVFCGYLPGTTNPTSWAPFVIDILDAFETTKNKTTRSLSGQRDPNWSLINLSSGSWRNTATITSILLDQEIGGNFPTGTRVSLYGIKATA